jgi:hypothetical protein
MTDTIEPLQRMFEPDVVLPSQFFATVHRQAPNKKAECRLLIAVLNDAIACFRKYGHSRNRRERRLFEEAETWIMSQDDAHRSRADGQAPCFSFQYVCQALGIDAEYLRQGLDRWRATQLGPLTRACNRTGPPCRVVQAGSHAPSP